METIKEYKGVEKKGINIFELEPHQHPLSRKVFWSAIVEEDMKVVKEIMDHDPILAFQYDEKRQTLLHWAAKRCNIELMNIVLKHNKSKFE